jgi:transcriptional regulator with XRE-family HTH domain
MTQKGLGEAIGVSEGAVGNWERGGAIAWPNAVSLARFFETTPTYIVNGDGNGSVPREEPHAGRDSVARLARLEAQITWPPGAAGELREHDRTTRAAMTGVWRRLDRIEERLSALEATAERHAEETRASIDELALALAGRAIASGSRASRAARERESSAQDATSNRS